MELKIRGFSVPETDNPFKELPFKKIRKFQKDFIENIDTSDVLFLSAPTGAGKTLCFGYLCKKGAPVLLLYPTTALMADQEKQLTDFGLRVFKLDSNTLGDIRGYARSRKLLTFFQRYDIIITNPDIISAIIHHMYVNPEEDLVRIFTYFSYIIYDEFHVFRELELSDIMLQVICFLSYSKAKVVLSSATPSLEFGNVLRSIKPDCRIKTIVEKGSKQGTMVRYDTKVCIKNENFKESVGDIIKVVIEKNLKTLVFCNSNKFARELYTSLVSEGYGAEVTKDTGDETRGDVKADLSKRIIISTSKSEIGIDYPLEAVIMDVAPDLQSFIQRFGRISRPSSKKEGTAFIFVKTLFNLDSDVGYYEFIETIADHFLEKKLSEKKFMALIEFRAYLILDMYKRHFEKLNSIFSNINWKRYYGFFKKLDEADKKLKQLGIKKTEDLAQLLQFLEDYKNGLSLLRGQSVTTKIKYQRGEDWVFTSYDLLHSLNNYEIREDDGYLTLVEPSDKNKIHSILYNGTSYDFYKFDKQLKSEVTRVWNRLENLGLVQKELRYVRTKLFYIDLARVIIPSTVVLRDGREIDVKNYLPNNNNSKHADTPSNIL